jgi:hypothetical protein
VQPGLRAEPHQLAHRVGAVAFQHGVGGVGGVEHQRDRTAWRGAAEPVGDVLGECLDAGAQPVEGHGLDRLPGRGDDLGQPPRRFDGLGDQRGDHHVKAARRELAGE